MSIDRVYTFKGGFSIRYQRTSIAHRLVITSEAEPYGQWTQNGPWVGMPKLLSFEIQGRFFIGQCLTALLPTVFEMVPSNETIVETAEPTKGTIVNE